MNPGADALLKGRVTKAPATIKILLVDPSPENRSLLKGALRSLNFVNGVRERSNLVDFAEVLKEGPFNVIMIDKGLTDMDPFQAVRTIRQNALGAAAGFVLMANNLDMEVRRQGIEAGVQGFLEKPFDMHSLEKALRDAQVRVSTNYKDALEKVRRITFFAGFSDTELVRLLKMCHTRKFSEGDTIIREGEHGDRLYVILSGRVNIVKRVEGKDEVLATLSSGECFGEMAIVDAEPRSADALAMSDCMAIEVHNNLFKDENDLLSLKLFRKIALLVTKKLRAFNEQRF